MQALNAENQQWPTRNDVDVFPFQGIDFPWFVPVFDCCHIVVRWTGFYISRPELKQYCHAGTAFWRAAQQLHTAVRMENYEDQSDRLNALWKVSLVICLVVYVHLGFVSRSTPRCHYWRFN